MLKNNKLFMFFMIFFVVLILFTSSVFAGTCNADISNISSVDMSYLKDCIYSVFSHCNYNNVDLSNYPYYFILTTVPGFSFSSEGQSFIIVLANSDVDYTSSSLMSSTSYGLNSGEGIFFEFQTGSSNPIHIVGVDSPFSFNLAWHSSTTSLFFTNFENDLVSSTEDTLDFFHLTPEGVLAPIVRKTPLEMVLQEIVGILPVVLVIIVGLIGLRKALKFLSMVLHRS